MTYIPIILMAIIIIFAISKQNSLKAKFTDFNFYQKESMQIANEIIKQQLFSVHCGTNRDTENKSIFQASAWQSITKTNTADFKFFDYYIVAKTEDEIYFIPVKIKGTIKLTLKVNPKMSIEKYKLKNVDEVIVKSNSKATLPTFDIKYTINSDLYHLVQFYGNINHLK